MSKLFKDCWNCINSYIERDLNDHAIIKCYLGKKTSNKKFMCLGYK